MTTLRNGSDLSGLRFDNLFTGELPADPSSDLSSRQIAGAAYSRVTPRVPSAPSTLAVSGDMMEVLGLDPGLADSDEFARVFTGATLLAGSDPHAAAYGGHQFGTWAGQLGDGRAISLGSVVTPGGPRLELQLKGAGATPYSRRADGLAVLRSSLREFVCSEAMHHLGVPTTRALSLALTGDMVLRDMLYDGNPQWEPGAVVCRVAPSFIRFGNFELFAWRQETGLLRDLADHSIRHHFPELGPPSPDAYAAMFGEVVRRTAHLMVEWARVGFVHGVMNTDNMSILGLTIDYGPYGWMEGYDPDWTPNTTDASTRRYRFGNQPAVAQWNLARLGTALIPLLESPEPLQQALDTYPGLFEDGWRVMTAAKLGMDRFDDSLVDDLMTLFANTEIDMPIFFRRLADIPARDADAMVGESTGNVSAQLSEAFYRPEDATGPKTETINHWLNRYLSAVATNPDDVRRRRMNAVNPLFVFRNYLAQEAIDHVAAGDSSMLHDLLDVLHRPYDDQPGSERFAAKRPEWARFKPGSSMLSCSS